MAKSKEQRIKEIILDVTSAHSDGVFYLSGWKEDAPISNEIEKAISDLLEILEPKEVKEDLCKWRWIYSQINEAPTGKECQHPAFGIKDNKRYCWTCHKPLGDMPAPIEEDVNEKADKVYIEEKMSTSMKNSEIPGNKSPNLRKPSSIEEEAKQCIVCDGAYPVCEKHRDFNPYTEPACKQSVYYECTRAEGHSGPCAMTPTRGPSTTPQDIEKLPPFENWMNAGFDYDAREKINEIISVLNAQIKEGK